MESILAKALELTLKYWLNSFSRDQFKLQGRTVQLSNLDINGDALHASAGFPPALDVTQAKVRKLEIKIPSVSNVQTEPIVVQIDRLDLVLTEKSEFETASAHSRDSPTNQAKNSGYGFADKIADGMTLQVETVNLMLETRGSIRSHGGSTWTPPLASITIHNLLLYTTNENWQVVNLKEAREFSNNKKYIYVFKKLEWKSLSVDLLPHPDMFMDENLLNLNPAENKRDDDGAKRLFFGGERFLDNISGQAYITIKRTEQNNPLGLEFQLHMPEAVCPALSEPGLRALLRFLTGVYVCMNRGDLGPKTQQMSTAAASSSLVAINVDHIFLSIKDAEFHLEFSMQSLYFSRASVSDGEFTKTLTRVMVGSFFLRDIFSRPHCTLVQPSMEDMPTESQPVPNFANERLWPSIYPLGVKHWPVSKRSSMMCLYSLQITPSPAPPSFASQPVILCQPIKINLQEESCLRIMSFLADGIVVNPGDILPDTSINHFHLSLKELNLSIPINSAKLNQEFQEDNSSFTGARLHIESFVFVQSPIVSFKLLNLEKDPACFTLWKGQPIDASQRKWVMRATRLTLSLESENDGASSERPDGNSVLWHCVEFFEPCIEGAMATPDGSPLVVVPPPGGVVRMGVACKRFISNTSVEQLFFVLKLYAYLGRVGEEISKSQLSGSALRQNSMQRKFDVDQSKANGFGSLVETVPSDTAVILCVDNLHLKFLESAHGQMDIQGPPLVQFSGVGLNIKVGHRTLGGAMVISSMIRWEGIQIDCIETELSKSMTYPESNNCQMALLSANFTSVEKSSDTVDSHPTMHAVLWTDCSKSRMDKNSQLSKHGSSNSMPFLEVDVIHVLPYRAQDAECHSLNVSAKIACLRLGGGMNYVEALLHRFGILGADGGPGEGLKSGLNNLSRGPLAKLLESTPPAGSARTQSDGFGGLENDVSFELTSPDDITIIIQLQDWLFALEGADSLSKRHEFEVPKFSIPRENRSWHMAFRSVNFCVKSKQKSCLEEPSEDENFQRRHPVDSIKVGVERIRILKPETLSHKIRPFQGNDCVEIQVPGAISQNSIVKENGSVRNAGFDSDATALTNSGIDLEVKMKISENDSSFGMGEWVIESMRFAVKDPVEVEATKEELDHLVLLSKSEIEAFSRIAVGILQVLHLHNSLGQAAINQLSNLGCGSLERVITVDRFKQQHNIERVSHNSSSFNSERLNGSQERTISILEQSLSDSQDICTSLKRKLSIKHSGEEMNVSGACIGDLEALSNHLQKMQMLLFKYHDNI
eukprot:TRINITY_DN5043_c0_g1_i2.p1 TRINITY_DN5043_c0_g1~~TRINITY_DN5043_c0_g1_i2.p1  ORF type:complete len:1276 (-),score=282.24 TRINITY_DN5043_c0_g1_i2:26-3853(-)